MLTTIGIIVFAIAITGSIAFHELGHLFFAKKSGVKVTQYMVGFGPTLWSRTKGETEYGIKLIPLGGYIRMIGMFAPAEGKTTGSKLALAAERIREDSNLEVQPGEEGRTFYAQPVRKKLAIMCGGPFANLLLAIIGFTIVLSVLGLPSQSTTLEKVVPCVSSTGVCVPSPAAASGLVTGDTITSINGVTVNSWSDLTSAIASDKPGQTMSVDYTRNGQPQTTTVTLAANAQGTGFLGVQPAIVPDRQPVWSAIPYVANMLGETLQSMKTLPAKVVGVGQAVTSDVPRDANGPVSMVGVGRITGQISDIDSLAVRWRIVMIIMLISGLNLVLFFFNMLPVPPLDGGQVLGAVWEGVRNIWARIWRLPKPKAPDLARVVPLSYAVALIFIVLNVLLMYADIIKPITIR